MKSLAYIPSSNQAANASLMTVQTLRSPGATTVKVNTVANVPPKFYGTMGTPHSFTDPVTSEIITIISEATAVDAAFSVSGSDIIIDAIAPGYVDTNGSKVGDIVVIKPVTEWANNLWNILSQSLNDDGTIKPAAVTYNPNIGDYVQTGGIWSALTGLNAAMTAITVWQGGYSGTVAAVASRAFTLSKDTYVDVLRTLSGYTNTFSLVYTEVANGAAAPTLANNSIRLGKIITNGTTITSFTQYGLDSLNNVIYPLLARPLINYSTQEQLTSEYWIDGKPIYRMTQALSLIASGSEQIFTVNLPAAATTIVKIEGGKKDTGSYPGDYYPFEYMNPGAPTQQNMQMKMSFVPTGTPHWEVRCNSGSAGTLYLTWYYVK